MNRWYILIIFFIALTNSMANADESKGNPKAIFWFDSHPGMPLPEEWQEKDTAKGLDEEFWYKNMTLRLGSPNHFNKIKSLGFDAIAIPGFEGPIRKFNPDSDVIENLNSVGQTRNIHYVKWAKEAGLETYLLVQFMHGSSGAENYSWSDDKQWKEISDYTRNIARFAKRHGADGLVFDFEPYGVTEGWHWVLQSLVKKFKFERQEILNLMRKRGREFANAIASEFPECVLHVYGIGCGSPTREDWVDSSVYFLAGLSEGTELKGGVHINDAKTYYEYKPLEIEYKYKVEVLPLLDETIKISKNPDYVKKNFSIVMGSAAIHRWYSEDGQYWYNISKVTTDSYYAHLISLRYLCPRYFWITAHPSFDWIMPEISQELKDGGWGKEFKDTWGTFGKDMPFSDLSERNAQLVGTFSKVMRLSQAEVAKIYKNLTGSQLLKIDKPTQPYQDDKYTVGLWHLDGDIEDDESANPGRGNDGKIGEFLYTEGIFRKAFQFSLQNKPIIIPIKNGNLDSKNMSYEVWINYERVEPSGAYLGGQKGRWFIRISPGATLTYGIWDNIGNRTEMSPGIKVSPNAWHYIAATYDGNFMRLYIDEEMAEAFPYKGEIGEGSKDLIISGFPWDPDGGGRIIGKIDEIRLSNIARIKEE